MTQYIDKDALVAELKKRISLFQKEKKTEKWNIEASQTNVISLGARIAMLEEILSFINTLEVKEVDLEKEIKDYFDNQPIITRNQCVDYQLIPSGEEFAKHFYELGLRAKEE